MSTRAVEHPLEREPTPTLPMVDFVLAVVMRCPQSASASPVRPEAANKALHRIAARLGSRMNLNSFGWAARGEL